VAQRLGVLQAGELFLAEDSTSESNKCNLKVAQYCAELERYPEAIRIYEAIARAAVENNLLKFSARSYLLNAGICHLCSAPPDPPLPTRTSTNSAAVLNCTFCARTRARVCVAFLGALHRWRASGAPPVFAQALEEKRAFSGHLRWVG
jgi:Soluble NSF attachment protein, SNAP